MRPPLHLPSNPSSPSIKPASIFPLREHPVASACDRVQFLRRSPNWADIDAAVESCVEAARGRGSTTNYCFYIHTSTNLTSSLSIMLLNCYLFHSCARCVLSSIRTHPPYNDAGFKTHDPSTESLLPLPARCEHAPAVSFPPTVMHSCALCPSPLTMNKYQDGSYGRMIA